MICVIAMMGKASEGGGEEGGFKNKYDIPVTAKRRAKDSHLESCVMNLYSCQFFIVFARL